MTVLFAFPLRADFNIIYCNKKKQKYKTVIPHVSLDADYYLHAIVYALLHIVYVWRQINKSPH